MQDSISTKTAYPMRTSTGSTKMAIWIEDPRATPIARSILFLYATRTAVICSQALPAMGRMISPRKASLRPDLVLTSEMASVRNLQRGSQV